MYGSTFRLSRGCGKALMVYLLSRAPARVPVLDMWLWRDESMQQVEYKSSVRKSGGLLMQQLPGTEGRAQGSSHHIQDRVTSLPPTRGQTGHSSISRFSISATVPPIATPVHTGVELAERPFLLQRADDMSTILRMLQKPQTST